MSLATLFTCSHCDAQYQKWTGRCLECGKWGTVQESQEIKGKQREKNTSEHLAIQTESLKNINTVSVQRLQTNIKELDTVLGGGIVPGSLILLGGEPGIGKSTLSLQIANAVQKTLYISGEESVSQIKLRADRLAISAPQLQLANKTDVDAIVATIVKEKPALAIVDSIQTIASDEASGGPGSPTQIRQCTTLLLEAAKASNTAVLLIGHVTKDGAVAGPKTLEHLVDVVLSFEGDRHHTVRLLRSVKNRFGPTDEVGIFEMVETGLQEVANPSALLLEERGENMPGSVVTCLMEGTRPILVEVQALVNKTSFGYPQRKASGFDLNRLHVLAAVLERRAGLPLGQYDIHINVVGGIKADEPGADLAVCLAIAGAFKDKALGNDLVVFGEVGLGGEVRSVRFLDKRLKEAAGLGMKRAISKFPSTIAKGKLKILNVKNINELIQQTK